MNKKLPTPSPQIYVEHYELEKQLRLTQSLELAEELRLQIREIESTYNFYPYIFQEGDLFGIKGPKGNVVVPARYQAFKFPDHFRLEKLTCVVAKKNNTWGVVSTDGSATVLVPFIYDGMTLFVRTAVKVKKDGKYSYIRPDGRLITPIEYDSIPFYDERFVCHNGTINSLFENDGQYGVMDDKGKYKLAHFDEIIVSDRYYLRAHIGEETGFITNEGEFSLR